MVKEIIWFGKLDFLIIVRNPSRWKLFGLAWSGFFSLQVSGPKCNFIYLFICFIATTPHRMEEP
jgi:hypothetical protein